MPSQPREEGGKLLERKNILGGMGKKCGWRGMIVGKSVGGGVW